jgi:Mor family transcriptional regulator
MEWKITSKKLAVVDNKKDYSCVVDDIANSDKIKELSKKYNISENTIHEFISQFLIKVFKEKKY